MAPAFDRNDLEEVATDLAEGVVNAPDREAGNIRDLIWDKNLLHGAGGFAFPRVALLVKPGPRDSEDENNEHGHLKQKVRNVLHGERDRPIRGVEEPIP